MKNAWLNRRPKIYQQLNIYVDFYGEWFITKNITSGAVYLHKDGVWRSSLFNLGTGGYSGYFKTKEEAEKILNKYEKRLVKT